MSLRARNRWQVAAAGFLWMFSPVLLSGCAPKLDEEKYGQVVTGIPKVEGADQPYPLPQLEESGEKPSSGEE